LAEQKQSFGSSIDVKKKEISYLRQHFKEECHFLSEQIKGKHLESGSNLKQLESRLLQLETFKDKLLVKDMQIMHREINSLKEKVN